MRSQIYDQMPHTMRSDLQELDKQTALKIMLSDLGQTYIIDWDTIYKNIVIRAWKIYHNCVLEIDKTLM